MRLRPLKHHIREHLAEIVRGVDDGRIQVRWTNGPDQTNWHCRTFRVDRLGHIVDEAMRCVGNFYVGPAILRPGAPDGPVTDKHVLSSSFLFVDIDDKEAADDFATRVRVCPPSFIVQTGTIPHRRFHAYWRLTEPLPADGIAAANRRLAEALGGDLAATNPSRLLRGAGTVCRPNAGKRKRGYREDVAVFQMGEGGPYADAFKVLNLLAPIRQKRERVRVKAAEEDEVAALIARCGRETDGGAWYACALRVVGKLRAKGLDRKTILTFAPQMTAPGWTVEQTRADLGKFFDDADRARPMRLAEEAFTAADLKSLSFEPLRFVVEPLIAPGATLIAGKPKIGKSWLLLELGLSVATGCMACGAWATDGGDVLLFACEDNRRRLKTRIGQLGGGRWPERLSILTNARRLGDGFEEACRSWALGAKAPKMIVVDTLNFIRPVTSGKDRGVYQGDYADSAVLTALAHELGVAIVVIHHLRKMNAGDGDPFDMISGSTGIAAGFDACIVMTRAPTGTIVLQGRGRDVENVEFGLSFDNTRWEVVGDAEMAVASSQRGRIVAALRGLGEAKPKEIAAASGVDHDVTRKLLFKMVEEGVVRKVGYGLYTVHSVHSPTSAR